MQLAEWGSAVYPIVIWSFLIVRHDNNGKWGRFTLGKLSRSTNLSHEIDSNFCGKYKFLSQCTLAFAHSLRGIVSARKLACIVARITFWRESFESIWWLRLVDLDNTQLSNVVRLLSYSMYLSAIYRFAPILYFPLRITLQSVLIIAILVLQIIVSCVHSSGQCMHLY